MGCVGSKPGPQLEIEGREGCWQQSTSLAAAATPATPGTPYSANIPHPSCTASSPHTNGGREDGGSDDDDDSSSSGSGSGGSSWDVCSGPGLRTMRSLTPTTASGPPLLHGTLGSFRESLLPDTPVSVRLRSPSIFNMQHSWIGNELLDSRPHPPMERPRTQQRLVITKLSGCTFVNQYLVIQYLGQGSSGRVFLCMHVGERRLYALKILRKSRPRGEEEGQSPLGGRRGRNPTSDLLREIAIMRGIGAAHHPNVVALKEVVDDDASSRLMLVMGYCEGGPVMTRRGLERGARIPVEVARPYFRDVAAAVFHLHSCRIMHGDLKPENALMSASGRVVLTDFGCSKVLGDKEEELDRCNGTPAFLAPEMMQRNMRYRGRPADVYALGAFLFTCVYGRIPFTAPTVAELFQVVQHQPLHWPEAPPVSPDLRSLLEGLLEKDPAKRLTMGAVAVHPWVTAGGRLPPIEGAPPSPLPAAAETRDGPSAPAMQHLGTAATAPPPAKSTSPAAGSDAAAGLADSPSRANSRSEAAALLPSSPPAAAAAAAAAAVWATGEDRDGSVEGTEDAAAAPSRPPLPPLDDAGQLLAGLLTPELQVQAYSRGQSLLHQGDRGGHMLYILEGQVEVVYRPQAMPAPCDSNTSGRASASASSAPATPTAGSHLGTALGSQHSTAHSSQPGTARHGPLGPSPRQGAAAVPGSAPPPAPLPPRELSTPTAPGGGGAAMQTGGSSAGEQAVPPRARTPGASKGSSRTGGGGLKASAPKLKSRSPVKQPRSQQQGQAVQTLLEQQQQQRLSAGPPGCCSTPHLHASLSVGSTGFSEHSFRPGSASSFNLGPCPATPHTAAPFNVTLESGMTHRTSNPTSVAGTPLPSARGEGLGGGGEEREGATWGGAAAVLAKQRSIEEEGTEAAAAPPDALDAPLDALDAAALQPPREAPPCGADEAAVCAASTSTPQAAAEATEQPHAAAGDVGAVVGEESEAGATAPALGATGLAAAAEAPPGGASSMTPAPAQTPTPTSPSRFRSTYGPTPHRIVLLTTSGGSSFQGPGEEEPRASGLSPTPESPPGAAAVSAVAVGSAASADQGRSPEQPSPLPAILAEEQSAKEPPGSAARESGGGTRAEGASSGGAQGSEDDGEREAVPPELLQASASAVHFVASLQRGPKDFLLAQRGAGDIIGEAAVLGGSSRRGATVRAASEVVRVAVVPYASAKHFLRAHPLAKQRLAEVSWARHSEALVLEALLRLASIRDDLAAAVTNPQPTP